MHRLTSARTDYYLADLGTELPLRRTGPWWEGRAAANLGLQGAVDPDQLRAVLEGRQPQTGRSLRSHRATIMGYDLTFSAPKSVSVLFALGGADVAREVVEAHQVGVHGALTYLEVHGVTARRGSGENRMVLPTSGLVAASFTHGVNRNQDPHVHTHVVMANLVHGSDGRWSACDQRGLVAHRAAAGAVYEAHTRAELTRRLGVRWVERGMQQTDIAGVSPLLLGEFSSRSADIRRHGQAHHVRSGRGDRVSWAVTRPAKPAAASFETLAQDWQRRAGAVDGAELVVARGGPLLRATLNEHRFSAALSWSPDGAARRRDVAGAFASSAQQGASASTVECLTDMWVPAGPPGVAELAQPRRDLVPSNYLLRTLGPRPVAEGAHGVWQEAARAIDAYRHTWDVRDRAEPLGLAEHSGLSSLPTARLIDHVHTQRQIDQARQRLGWQPPRVLELERGR